MSGPVNVLAVMDVHIAAMAAGRGRVSCKDAPFYDESREKFQEARAAVAELIEAAEQAHEFLCEKAPATATEFRLRNALSRVRGAA